MASKENLECRKTQMYCNTMNKIDMFTQKIITIWFLCIIHSEGKKR